jgi:hypothetical protein
MGDTVKTGIEKAAKPAHKYEKILIGGHKFELILVTKYPNTANKKAQKCRKHGFYTRVIELPLGVFSVYRRHKTETVVFQKPESLQRPSDSL